MDDDHLTSRQAAAYLGVAIRTLRRWADDGRLPHYRTPGGHRRFLRSDLAALRAERRAGRPLPGLGDHADAWARSIDEALASAIAALGPDEGAIFQRLRTELSSSRRRLADDHAASRKSKDSKPPQKGAAMRTIFPREATAQEITDQINSMLKKTKR